VKPVRLYESSNMTFFMAYTNNAIIKFLIYFTSHMCIAREIMDIIPERFQDLYRTRVHTNIKRESST
jgi:hypothetical protein